MTGGALCLNGVQRGQSKFVSADEFTLGVAGSCAESLGSIICTVHVVIDTAWGDECVQRFGEGHLSWICVLD